MRSRRKRINAIALLKNGSLRMKREKGRAKHCRRLLFGVLYANPFRRTTQGGELMAKQLPGNTGEVLPSGWPEGMRIPTLEQAEEAVRQGEETIIQMMENLKGKMEGTSPEMFNTQITI